MTKVDWITDDGITTRPKPAVERLAGIVFQTAAEVAIERVPRHMPRPRRLVRRVGLRPHPVG